MSTDSGTTSAFRERTAWARNLAAPVRDFVSNETGGALALLAATIAALVWANSPWSDSYESLWTTHLSIRLGGSAISLDLRHWVNQGLMTFFFLVVGLEAKRELDLGELRERQRLTIPVFGALGGMTVPVAHLPRVQRRRARARTAGVRRCRPTRRSRSECWRCSPRTGTRLRVMMLLGRGGGRPGGAARDRDRLHEARLDHRR